MKTVNEELIELAEETRRRAFDIMARALIEQDGASDPFGDEPAASSRVEEGSTAALAGALCDAAADAGRQAQMLAERAEGYDLGKLAGVAASSD